MRTLDEREEKKRTNNDLHKDKQRYFTIWRWHFYAGMFVAPFLIVLACTGLAMMIISLTTGRFNDRISVESQANEPLPLSTQAQHALDTLPHSSLTQYIAPQTDSTVALFKIKAQDIDNFVAINPYNGEVVRTTASDGHLYHLFERIHGDLLIGPIGDFILETAASLTILLILTGIYLWWHKRKSVRKMLIPNTINTKQKRNLFRTIHATLGSWVAVVLLFFCLTGLAWAGIWGGKMVQAWNQFPAGKWGNEPTPLSINPNAPAQPMTMSAPKPHVHGQANHDEHDDMTIHTHGEVLNAGGTKEVPWVLELTPMPKSGTTLGDAGIASGVPITIDTVDRYAREIGFEGRYQLNLPQGDTGVWTLSQDSMSYDMDNPFADRTVHIDRYSGNVLADIRFEDYNLFGKFMAAGIALHMGTLGWFSVLANVLFCLSVIAICISGYVLWWIRRPSKSEALSLNPPPFGNGPALWGFSLLLLVVAILFPAAILSIIAIALIDFVIVSRSSRLKRLLK